jgi:transcriptional regulator with XRE-family HTH domain
MYSKVEKLVNFSEWLKEEMQYREITATKLAKMSGVHPNTIHNYLSNKCEPTLFIAQCIVNALGHDLGVLYR